MDHPIPFQLVPKAPRQSSATADKHVVFAQLPAESQEQLSDWIDNQLADLIADNAGFESLNSTMKHLVSDR